MVPDQSQHFVGPDLGPNCLQWLSEGDTSKQRVRVSVVLGNVNLLYGRKVDNNGVVRTLKKLRTSKDDYCIKQ